MVDTCQVSSKLVSNFFQVGTKLETLDIRYVLSIHRTIVTAIISTVRTLIRPYMDYSTTIRMLFSKYIANIQSFQLGSCWNQVGRSWIPTWKKFGSIHRTIVTAIIYTIRTPTKSNSNYSTIAFSVHQQYSEFPTWPSWNAPNH